MKMVMHSEHVRHRNVVLCALDLSYHASLLFQPFVFRAFFVLLFALVSTIYWVKHVHALRWSNTVEAQLKIPSMCWFCEGLGYLQWAKTLTCIDEKSTCQSFHRRFDDYFCTNKAAIQLWYSRSLHSLSDL